MFVVFGVLFVFIFYILNFVRSFKNSFFDKVSSFECGFSSIGLIQNSFRIHFFVIMIMFVVFDLEIVIFLGILISDTNSYYLFLILFIFIVFGFYIEWWYGKLL